MQLNETIKQKIRERIEHRAFYVDQNKTYFIVELEGIKYTLLNNDIIDISEKSIDDIFGDEQPSIFQIIGISPKEFYDKYRCSKGYRLCRNNEGYLTGTIKTDVDNGYGLFFTINESDIFRFIMANFKENYGTNLAHISFTTPNGAYLESANIVETCRDTANTFRTSQFYISDIISLNDYDLIIHYYDIAINRYKSFIGYDWMYTNSIKYYEMCEYIETVKALKELHEEYMKNPLRPEQWYE